MAGIDARSITIPDDWWMMRTDALAMVMAAFNTGEEEAARTLAVFCLGHPTEWQYSRQIVTAPSVKVAGENRFLHPRRVEAVIPIEFWRQVLAGFGRAEGNSASYIGPAFMAGPPFPATVILGEIKYPGKVNNVVRLDTGWRVEIHLSNIRLRAAPLIEDIRQDGGMIDAGLERLRSLGRLPSFMSTAPDQATTAPAAAVEVTRRRGTALQVAQTLESHPSDGYTMAGYIDKVLRPLRPPLSVGRKTLFNILSGIAREQPAPGKPPLWRGKSSGPDRPPSGRR